jgi:hypothetical protein
MGINNWPTLIETLKRIAWPTCYCKNKFK